MFTFEPAPTSEIWDKLITCQENIIKIFDQFGEEFEEPGLDYFNRDDGSWINRVWKNKISVLMGDFILSKALINMIGLKDFDALEQISSTAEKLSAGEILQIEKSITRSMTEDVYFETVSYTHLTLPTSDLV